MIRPLAWPVITGAAGPCGAVALARKSNARPSSGSSVRVTSGRRSLRRV